MVFSLNIAWSPNMSLHHHCFSPQSYCKVCRRHGPPLTLNRLDQTSALQVEQTPSLNSQVLIYQHNLYKYTPWLNHCWLPAWHKRMLNVVCTETCNLETCNPSEFSNDCLYTLPGLWLLTFPRYSLVFRASQASQTIPTCWEVRTRALTADLISAGASLLSQDHQTSSDQPQQKVAWRSSPPTIVSITETS